MNNNEVIRADLHNLRRNQQAHQKKGPQTLPELEAQLLPSVVRLDRGEGVDGKKVFRRLGKRIHKARGQ